MPDSIFLFTCCMMVLQLVWVRPMVPETRDVPLEKIEHRLTGTRSPNPVVRAEGGCRELQGSWHQEQATKYQGIHERESDI